MEKELEFYYDRTADILNINLVKPHPEQETEELDDDIIARINSKTNEIENLEILFFSTRLLKNDLFKIPIGKDTHFYNVV